MSVKDAFKDWAEYLGWEFRMREAVESDINEHLGTLYNLTFDMSAQRVLELGVGGGNSASAFLAALSRTGGTLFSVEKEQGVVDNALTALCNPPIWATFIGDDRAATIVATMRRHSPFDIVFIDTTHNTEHTEEELELYPPMIRKGGYLVLHDTEAPGVIGPLQRWLAMGERATWAFTNYKHNHGLGVIRIEGGDDD